ncbi:MAG TPA: sigma 54-interacting transcriptional regulator [Bryobacteraceae bacterium]|nr:sigma 54-interacting transcriptional regulator [Bryobacteraceae bacterium]
MSTSALIRSNPGLRSVWRALEVVAPTNSVVLILGETGTGKELVARAVHDESPRKHGRYVKVNCAAMPAGLIENELFGHERGAFTGALSRTDGRFQQAHGGTLFLDEIGELPLELQPKLLRVLQERECERVGGGCTIRVDVRVIAATNSDLEQMVSQRRFRADLFYRLNVFPILIPPLRDRLDDIPLITKHFIRILSSQMNKDVSQIADEALKCLRRHTWPGNVRELQNVIERAVIRSSGTTVEISTEELRAASPPTGAMRRMLAETERSHILHVLKETNGVVSGPNGAASRLGLPRTTLASRMQKLGIVQRKTVQDMEGNSDL